MKNKISLTTTSNNFNISDENLNNIMKFMCGRIDFYWEYQNGVPFMVKEKLNPEKFNLHFLGGNALGFSPFIDNDTIMFLGWDFDAHTSDELSDDENNNLIKQAQEDSMKVYEYLKSWNLAVIINSSGSKGRHVRLYCEGANAKKMRVFGHYVLLKVLGEHDKHEVFPKQDNLNEERKFGNQMKGFFCVHPKHKKRANLIAGSKVLDFNPSLKILNMALENKDNPIQINPKDYEMVEILMNGKTSIKFNSKNFSFSKTDNDIHSCNFIENIATKKVLPSKGKFSRHTCIDPNIQAYSYFNPQAKLEYAKMQGRSSDTAFKNWEHYWLHGKPTLKCGQIISYLKHNIDNPNCKEGLKVCLACPYFKQFIEEKHKPRGLSNSFNISEIAKLYNLEKCPACNSKYKFKDANGLWYCELCKKGGGITKFLKIISILNRGTPAQ